MSKEQLIEPEEEVRHSKIVTWNNLEAAQYLGISGSMMQQIRTEPHIAGHPGPPFHRLPIPPGEGGPQRIAYLPNSLLEWCTNPRNRALMMKRWNARLPRCFYSRNSHNPLPQFEVELRELEREAKKQQENEA